MLHQKPPLIVKINSSLSTEIFDCRIVLRQLTNKRVFNVSQLSSSTWWNFTAAPSFEPCIQHKHARPYSCWMTPTWKIYIDKMCVKARLKILTHALTQLKNNRFQALIIIIIIQCTK